MKSCYGSRTQRTLALLATILGLGAGIPCSAEDHIFYVGGGGTQIRRARLDGTSDHLVLTVPPGQGLGALSVSEDGGRIAYAVGPTSASFEAWVAASDGTSPQKLGDAPWTVAVIWLPGDSHIAFNKADASGGGTGSRFYRTPAPGEPVSLWLPADPFIPFDGANTFRSAIRWSADRTRFVTSVGSGGGAGNTVFVGTVDIAVGTVADVRRLSPQGSGSWSSGVSLDAEISRDGSTVFYVWRDESIDRAEIRRIGFDGTGEQTIRHMTAANAPGRIRLGPDGTRLWFLSRGPSHVIASVDLDGNGHQEHVSSPTGLGPFDFGPVAVCRGPLCAGDVFCDFEDGDACGTPVDTVSFCPAACGSGLCLAGGASVDLGDADPFSDPHLEIELDVRLNRLPQPGENASGLVTKYRGHTPGDSEWALFVEKSGTWVLCGDGSQCVSTAPGTAAVGVSYHVRALLRGGLGELWVDGVLAASGPVARNPGNTITPVIIGNSAQPGHANPFFGTIDNLRIGCGPNRPPIANAGPDQVVEAISPTATSVTLDGTGSFDPDGDPLTFAWSGPFGAASGAQPAVGLALGTHTIVLTVDDGRGESRSDDVVVTVRDTTPPTITSVRADPAVLWPPNHELVPVRLTVATDDLVDATPTCRVPNVSSSEPPDTHEPDWVISLPLGLMLRAEREGSGPGRTYAVTVECRDAAGNVAVSQAVVRVPHDQRKR